MQNLIPSSRVMDEKKRIQQSLGYLQQSFKSYYYNHRITLPDRFSRREFAFMFFGGKGMLRHLSFSRKQKYQEFLIQRSPAHCYYSTAYYKTPDAQTGGGCAGLCLLRGVFAFLKRNTQSNHHPKQDAWQHCQQRQRPIILPKPSGYNLRPIGAEVG